MKKIKVESLIGMGILLFCASCLFYLFSVVDFGNTHRMKNVTLRAKFNNIDGITKGTDVKVSGVKVGHVSSVVLDKNTFQAIVYVAIDDSIKIPKDSILSVSTSGLIGAKYLEIKAGFEDEYLADNEFFTTTQSAQNIEDLISKFVAK